MALQKVSPALLPAENYKRLNAALDAIDAGVGQDGALADAIQDVRMNVSQFRDAFVVETHDRIDADRIIRDGTSQTFQNIYSTLTAVAMNADNAVAAERQARIDALAASVRSLTDLIAQETAARLAAAAPSLHRPGDGPQSFTRGSFASISLPPLPDSLIAFGENGYVARVTGPDIIAARRPMAIEAGRRYRPRFVVQRRRNVADPSNHGIRCGVAWLDQTGQLLRGSAGVTVVRDVLKARTSDGRIQVGGTMARYGVNATLAAPAGAVYARPFVQTFGDDGVTDIEVMDIIDVTDLAVLPDLSADLAASVQAIQAQNVVQRLESVEAQQSAPNGLTFPTRGDAAAASIPTTVTGIQTRGLAAVGDGQSALYRRGTQADAAAADGSFQSTDGAYWLPSESSALTVAKVPNISLRIGPNSSTPAPYLSKIAYGQVPILDMFGPYRDGVRGDEKLANAILDGHNALRIKPNVGGVGPVLAKDGPILVPQNGKFGGISGKQLSSIVRLDGYTGDTIQAGSPTTGMGSAEIENLWFPAAGRFVGAVPAGYSLKGRLSNGATHIRAYGSQSGVIRNCGAFPICSFITQQGGYGLTIENTFTIGGLWDRQNPALQEAVAVLVTNYDPAHGHPTCTTVINPNWVGGNSSAEVRQITLYGKTYTCQERIGPKYGWLHAAGEDHQLLGGFLGGFSRSPIAILPGGPELINGWPAWVQIKFTILGARIDESMWAGIEALRSDVSQAIMNILTVAHCEFNGQLVSAHGIDIGPSALMAITRLRMSNNLFAAYQGAGARFYAVDGGEVDKTEIYGANLLGFDTVKGDPIDYGAGLIVGGLTRNLGVTNLRGGGGPNSDANPNNMQYLFADTTPVANGKSTQGNSYYRVRANNLGLGGGTPVVGGVNDAAA